MGLISLLASASFIAALVVPETEGCSKDKNLTQTTSSLNTRLITYQICPRMFVILHKNLGFSLVLIVLFPFLVRSSIM